MPLPNINITVEPQIPGEPEFNCYMVQISGFTEHCEVMVETSDEIWGCDKAAVLNLKETIALRDALNTVISFMQEKQ